MNFTFDAFVLFLVDALATFLGFVPSFFRWLFGGGA